MDLARTTLPLRGHCDPPRFFDHPSERADLLHGHRICETRHGMQHYRDIFSARHNLGAGDDSSDRAADDDHPVFTASGRRFTQPDQPGLSIFSAPGSASSCRRLTWSYTLKIKSQLRRRGKCFDIKPMHLSAVGLSGYEKSALSLSAAVLSGWQQLMS